MIRIRRKIISIKASPILCRPKKIPDQATLAANWPKYNWTAFFLVFFLLRPDQMIYRATAIKKNKVVQTGAKSQSGGVKPVLLILAYQPWILGLVRLEPSQLAPKVIAREPSSLGQSILFIASRWGVVINNLLIAKASKLAGDIIITLSADFATSHKTFLSYLG